eukprot:PhF_6_TR43636/c0_g1_i2/m.67054
MGLHYRVFTVVLAICFLFVLHCTFHTVQEMLHDEMEDSYLGSVTPTFHHVAQLIDAAISKRNQNTSSPTLLPYFATFVMEEWRELNELLLSINVPTQYLHVVVNSDTSGRSMKYITALSRALQRYIHLGHVIVTYSPPGDPYSFAESANIVLRDAFQNNHVPYLLMVNADIMFGRYTLMNALQYYEQHDLRDSLVGLGVSFSAILMSHSVFQKVGLFDENFYPAYWEDFDYMIRMKREGVPFIELNLLPGIKDHVVVYHHQSLALRKSSSDYLQRFRRMDRWIYAFLKWGCRERHLGNVDDIWEHPQLFRHPFNVSALPTSYWVKDTHLRNCCRTGFRRDPPSSNDHIRNHCWFNVQVVVDDITSSKKYQNSWSVEEKQYLQWLVLRREDVSNVILRGKCTQKC